MNSNSKSRKKNSTHFQIQRLISWLVFVFFGLVTPNNFIPYYSHPFSGYILPGCTFKRKGGQVRFTPQQTQNLEQEFNNHKYLSPEDRKKLARELKLSDRQVWPLFFFLQKFTNIPMKLRFILKKVKTWFQNRRAKFRRTSVIGSSAKCDVICKNNLMHSHANCSYMREHPMDKPSEADQSQHDQFDDMKTKSNCTNF